MLAGAPLQMQSSGVQVPPCGFVNSSSDSACRDVHLYMVYKAPGICGMCTLEAPMP